MSASCHHHAAPFTGLSADYRRRLWLVILINAGMFAVEIVAGAAAGSQALLADSLDFAADAATYGLSLAVIGASLRVRAGAALLKAASLTVMAAAVLGMTAWRVLVAGVPDAGTMGVVGVMALLANLASVLILVRYKDGDANVRSVWLCSRNDAIGNLAVIAAAAGVWGTTTGWPDLAVATGMAGLFLYSSVQILRQALAELRDGDHAAAGHPAHHH